MAAQLVQSLVGGPSPKIQVDTCDSPGTSGALPDLDVNVVGERLGGGYAALDAEDVPTTPEHFGFLARDQVDGKSEAHSL